MYSTDILLAHFKYGLHSGIPFCCVVEWISDMNNDISGIVKFRELQCGCSINVEYVPCQKCTRLLAEGKITPASIHWCNPIDNSECDAILREVWANNIPKYEKFKADGAYR